MCRNKLCCCQLYRDKSLYWITHVTFLQCKWTVITSMHKHHQHNSTRVVCDEGVQPEVGGGKGEYPNQVFCKHSNMHRNRIMTGKRQNIEFFSRGGGQYPSPDPIQYGNMPTTPITRSL